jgi:hypothetical protein
MKAFKKITLLLVPVALCFAMLINNSSCGIYKFKDISPIPDSIKTVKVNLFINKARYVNVQLSPRLSDKLRQKIVGQTRLTQTNSDSPDWEINGDITDYTLTTSAISGQREAGNRLTVGIHVTLIDHKSDETKQYDISRPFEFGASQSLQQAEAALLDEMVRGLSDDIFNRIFSAWGG